LKACGSFVILFRKQTLQPPKQAQIRKGPTGAEIVEHVGN
jgi:hypothetical protein